MITFDVYQILNSKTGKTYVGSSTVGYEVRFDRHKRDLLAGRHHSTYLQRSWDKYGPEAFSISLIERLDIPDTKVLLQKEQFYLDKFKTYDSEYGYNMCKVAGSRKGRKHSVESKEKMSIAKLGKTFSEETKDKQSTKKVKLSTEQVLNFMKYYWIDKESMRSIGKRFGFPHESIRCIVHGKYRYTKEIYSEFLKIHGVK